MERCCATIGECPEFDRFDSAMVVMTRAQYLKMSWNIGAQSIEKTLVGDNGGGVPAERPVEVTGLANSDGVRRRLVVPIRVHPPAREAAGSVRLLSRDRRGGNQPAKPPGTNPRPFIEQLFEVGPVARRRPQSHQMVACMAMVDGAPKQFSAE